MTNIVASGYIVADNMGIVYGFGLTADDALADAERTMKSALIKLLDDDDDSAEQLGSWTRRSGLVTYPATAALLKAISDRGGAFPWGMSSGIACTREEEV